jgi:hypothetical protein
MIVSACSEMVEWRCLDCHFRERQGFDEYRFDWQYLHCPLCEGRIKAGNVVYPMGTMPVIETHIRRS